MLSRLIGEYSGKPAVIRSFNSVRAGGFRLAYSRSQRSCPVADTEPTSVIVVILVAGDGKLHLGIYANDLRLNSREGGQRGGCGGHQRDQQ